MNSSELNRFRFDSLVIFKCSKCSMICRIRSNVKSYVNMDGIIQICSNYVLSF